MNLEDKIDALLRIEYNKYVDSLWVRDLAKAKYMTFEQWIEGQSVTASWNDHNAGKKVVYLEPAPSNFALGDDTYDN